MKASVVVRYASCILPGIVVVLGFAGSAGARAGKVAENSCGTVFGAQACTSYRTRSGKVTEFSLSVPVAVIEQAPANVPMVWPPKADVSVPFAPAVREQTGFTFASIYWEAGGHPPPAYMVPHFDFHFYFVPEAQVQAIDCKDTSKPGILPAGYSLPDVNIPQIGELVGVCVPAMGMLAVPNGDLSLTTAWDGSLLVGYYSGKPLFLEPMITRALLLRKHAFSLTIPQIEGVAQVRYPRRFRAVYLSKSKTYRFTFSY